MRESPAIGQAYCHFFDIDDQGWTTQEACRQRRKSFLRNRPVNLDYKRELLVRGTIINHLRTYRREVFAVVGLFNETLRYGVDYEMALRIFDRFYIALVPEFLYYHRVHRHSITGSLSFQNLRFWWQRYHICCRLWRNNQVRFINLKGYNLHGLMITGLIQLFNLRHKIDTARQLLNQRPIFLHQHLKRFRMIAVPQLHDHFTRWFSGWPIQFGSALPDKRKLAHRHPHIAYYLWKFPRPTLTFIERELRALQLAGMDIIVIADSGDDSYPEYRLRDFSVNVHYLHPLDVTILARHRRYFLLISK
jgi:hypothetical protein